MTGIANVGGVATIKGFEGLFQNIVTSILSLAAFGLFIMLLIGGFRYLSSAGNPKQLESAKLTLTFAILGIVLVALTFLILRLIEDFTGAPVTNFIIEVPTPTP